MRALRCVPALSKHRGWPAERTPSSEKSWNQRRLPRSERSAVTRRWWGCCCEGGFGAAGVPSSHSPCDDKQQQNQTNHIIQPPKYAPIVRVIFRCMYVLCPLPYVPVFFISRLAHSCMTYLGVCPLSPPLMYPFCFLRSSQETSCGTRGGEPGLDDGGAGVLRRRDKDLQGISEVRAIYCCVD